MNNDIKVEDSLLGQAQKPVSAEQWRNLSSTVHHGKKPNQKPLMRRWCSLLRKIWKGFSPWQS